MRARSAAPSSPTPGRPRPSASSRGCCQAPASAARRSGGTATRARSTIADRMRDVEERAEAVLAALPGYVWDGDTAARAGRGHRGHAVRAARARRRGHGAARPGRRLVRAPRRCPGCCSPRAARSGSTRTRRKQWPPRRRFTIGHELGHWVDAPRRRPAGAVLPRSTRRRPRRATSRRRPARSPRRCSCRSGCSCASTPARRATWPRCARTFGSSIAATQRRIASLFYHGSGPAHPAAGAPRDERARRRGQARDRARGRRGRAAADRRRVAAGVAAARSPSRGSAGSGRRRRSTLEPAPG